MVELSWEESGVIRTLSGPVTAAELDASAIAIQESEYLDEMRYNIHDFSAVSEVFMSDSDVEYMAARAAVSIQRNQRLRIAFVGNHNIVGRLMNAFNNNGYSHHRVHRFDTLEAARDFAAGKSSIPPGANPPA